MNIKWTALRACVMVQQKNICAMCKKVTKDNEFTLHHIIPRAEGGKDELDNLIGLCNPCHDIAEEKKLSREEINNYWKGINSNKPNRKGHFAKTEKAEYDYPEEIILQEKYIMPKVIIGFQTNEEFKERVIEAGKRYKIQGVLNPVNLSMFCRIAVSKLLGILEMEEGSKK